MNRLLIITIGAVLISGCNTAEREKAQRLHNAANDAALTAEKVCYERDRKKEFKSRTEYMICMNEAENYQKPLLKYPDLLDLKFAVRRALGQKIDGGALTQAEAEVEFQKTVSSIAAETQRRDLATRAVAVQEGAAADARQQQASAAMLAAGAALLAPPQPSFAPPPPLPSTPVRCNSQRLGNYVQTNCF